MIGGFLVAVLVAALAVPPLVDWANFRTAFEREASRLLGQPVSVAGATSARLLPWPKVEFEAVRIGRGKDGAPLLALDRLAFDVEIAPLLRGNVRIVDMQLDRPMGRLAIGQEGGVDWLQGAGALTLPASDVSIERLSVLEGALTVVDAARDTEIELTAINAELTADTLAGPWRGQGAVTFEGQRYDLSGTTGNLRQDGVVQRIATRLSIEPRSQPYTITATGPVSITDGDATFEGGFTVEPRQEAELEPQPVFVDGTVRLTREQLNLPAFVVRIGEGDDPYRMEGRAEAFFEGDRRYALRLQGAQMDVDRVATASSENAALRFDRRLAVVSDILRQVPLPSLAGTVRLELPALVAGDTVIRELRADLRPRADAAAWEVARFEATLPGRTLLEASGTLAVPRTAGDGIGFQGRVLLASRQPSGFASWLATDVDDAIRRLDTAGFQADVKIGNRSARFDDLELLFGSDRLTGTLARISTADGTRPRILADLEGSRVDVDTARAVFALFSGGGPSRSETASLLAHDLDLRLKVDAAVGAGLSARDVDLVGLYEAGSLRVDRLTIGDVEGASADLRGSIDDLYGRPKGGVTGTVSLQNAAKFAGALDRRKLVPAALRHFVREPALLDGTRFGVALDASRAGTSSEFSLDLDGMLGSSELRAALSYGTAPSGREPDVALGVTASNAQPLALLRQLGLRPAPVELSGPAELVVRASGRAPTVQVKASLESPDGRVATKGELRYEPEQGDVYEGRIELAGDDIDPLLLAFGLGVPGVGLGTSVDLSGDLVADAARVSVDALQGTVRNVPLEGSLVLDLDIEPRPRVDGTLTVDALDLTTMVRAVFGQAFDPSALSGSGQANELGTPLLSGLDGDILLEAKTADLSMDLLPSAPAENFEAELIMNDGDLRFERMSAKWLGGTLEGTATIGKAGRNGLIGADIELKGASIDRTGLVDAGEPRLSGRFDLKLAVEAQAQTDRGLVEALSGGARFDVRDAKLRGFSPEAFPSVLEAADATDDAALEGAAGGIASNALLSGETEIGNVAIDFTLANGIARATGVPLSLGEIDASADLRVDLPKARVEGTVRGTLTAPADEQPVSGIAPDFRVDFEGTRGSQTALLDATTLTTYLATRLRERREREFEAQRAAILERRRLVQAMRLSRERERRDAERLRRRDAARAEELPG